MNPEKHPATNEIFNTGNNSRKGVLSSKLPFQRKGNSEFGQGKGMKQMELSLRKRHLNNSPLMQYYPHTGRIPEKGESAAHTGSFYRQVLKIHLPLFPDQWQGGHQLCDHASYFSATTSISKSSVVNLSFLENAPSLAPKISILPNPRVFNNHVISLGT